MKSILNKVIVLKLNRNWQKVGACSVRRAFVNMCDDKEKSAVVALAIDYEINPDGSVNRGVMINATPMDLESWMELPVRPYDLAIQMPHKAIRAPTVVIAKSFAHMPWKSVKLNKGNLFKRDKGRCGYTGKALTKKNATIDHIIPKDRGGKNEWHNVTLCEKKLNHDKGNRLNEEIGLKLLNKPREPAPTPISFRIAPQEEDLCHDWSFF
jgi:5-methylcytosine-specific restriction endonuclease McrA